MAAPSSSGWAGGGCRPCLHSRPGSYDTDTPIGVLQELGRFLGGENAALLWGRLPAHRSTAMRAFAASQRHWLVVGRLPGYAPEPNPVEALWANRKGKGDELANLAGDTLDEATQATPRADDRVGQAPQLPGSFLRHYGLSLW